MHVINASCKLKTKRHAYVTLTGRSRGCALECVCGSTVRCARLLFATVNLARLSHGERRADVRAAAGRRVSGPRPFGRLAELLLRERVSAAVSAAV